MWACNELSLFAYSRELDYRELEKGQERAGQFGEGNGAGDPIEHIEAPLLSFENGGRCKDRQML